MVDLRRAIESMQLSDDDPTRQQELLLELHLARTDGQVANPKVVLERLFLLGPEEQAKLRITRTSLLRRDGRVLVAEATPMVELSPAR